MPKAQGKRSRPVVADPVADRVWVEELAMLLERQGGGGFPRTAGRVLALLLVADQATVTQADLAERLSVSQAAVSPAVRFLVDAGYLERTRAPGVRREQYRLREQSWSQVLHAAALSIDTLVRHLHRGLDLPGPDISAGRAHLIRLAGLYELMRDLLEEAAGQVDDVPGSPPRRRR
jgi:DNA-binding MarR family transcriptional regulator